MMGFRKLHGISGIAPLLSISQFPFLITWFLQLRYMATSPDLFPGMENGGYLWFENLCQYDPIFILPLLSSVLTSLNIKVS
jgi:membrane protein insertase Oxa1/YidC/SpoIIIJ